MSFPNPMLYGASLGLTMGTTVSLAKISVQKMDEEFHLVSTLKNCIDTIKSYSQHTQNHAAFHSSSLLTLEN